VLEYLESVYSPLLQT